MLKGLYLKFSKFNPRLYGSYGLRIWSFKKIDRRIRSQISKIGCARAVRLRLNFEIWWTVPLKFPKMLDAPPSRDKCLFSIITFCAYHLFLSRPNFKRIVFGYQRLLLQILNIKVIFSIHNFRLSSPRYIKFPGRKNLSRKKVS